MDEFDIKMLNALQQDGRLTNNDLAERVGLSASQCSRRRAALEQTGVIAGYHAALAAEALGFDVLVFVQVTLAKQATDYAEEFQKLIERTEEVQEAYSLTGEADYLIKLAVPDLKALSRVLTGVFLSHRSVAHIRSSVVLGRVKQTTSLPLGYLSTSRQVPGSQPQRAAGRKRRAAR